MVRNHSTIVEAVVGGKIVAASQILFLAAAPARSNPEKFRPVSCPRMRIDLVVRFRVTGSSHRTTGTLVLQVLLRVLNSDLFLEYNRWSLLVRVLANTHTVNSTSIPTTAVLVPLRPYRY